LPGFCRTTVLALLNLPGNHPSRRQASVSTASTLNTGRPQAFSRPVGRRSSPGAFQGLILDRVASISFAVTFSSIPNLGSHCSSRSGSCTSERSASRQRKNLPARALAFSWWVERSGHPGGPARAGSFGGSRGLKLLQRAHRSRLQSRSWWWVAFCSVVLQAFVFSLLIVAAKVRRL